MIPTAVSEGDYETAVGDSPFAIGVAMSGGGYRAAAYHLGTLSYLQHLELIPQVEALSTVSGGTFTGARYLLSLVEGDSFDTFMVDYYSFLLNTDLLILAIQKLGPERSTNNLPRQLAIDAFAQVYADTLLQKKDGSVFLMKEILDFESPLTDVIFNSTDFRCGVGFRFQKSLLPSKFGNRFDFLTEEQARSLRVADIVAASSCFPGGFEPISWPQSFVHHPEVDNTPLDQQLAMMDGGIYDNQGIQSLLLADQRSRSKENDHARPIAELAQAAERFHLLIISDTDRLDENIYTFPPPPPPSFLGSFSLGTLWWMFWCVISLCGVTLIVNAVDLYAIFTTPKRWSVVGAISHLTSLLLSLAVVLTGLSAWNLLYLKLAPRIPHWDRIRNDLKHLLLSQSIDMIQLRVSSLFALANDIFMKRIRSLVYEEIYSNAKLRVTAVTSMIYKLKKYSAQQTKIEKNEFDKSKAPQWPFDDRPEIPRPSQKLLTIVDISVDMPTTLWFDDKSMLPKLVVTGQATLCFQLLSYLHWTCGPDPAKYPDMERKLWDMLVRDWQAIQIDPYVILRQSLPDTTLQATLPIAAQS